MQRKINSHSKSTPYTKVNQKWVLQGTHTIQGDQNLFHQFSDILCEDMEGPTGMKPCTQNKELLYIYPQDSNVGSFWLPCNAPLAVQFCVYLLGHILIHLAYYLCDALLQLMQGMVLEMGGIHHTVHKFPKNKIYKPTTTDSCIFTIFHQTCQEGFGLTVHNLSQEFFTKVLKPNTVSA